MTGGYCRVCGVALEPDELDAGICSICRAREPEYRADDDLEPVELACGCRFAAEGDDMRIRFCSEQHGDYWLPRLWVRFPDLEFVYAGRPPS